MTLLSQQSKLWVIKIHTSGQESFSSSLHSAQNPGGKHRCQQPLFGSNSTSDSSTMKTHDYKVIRLKCRSSPVCASTPSPSVRLPVGQYLSFSLSLSLSICIARSVSLCLCVSVSLCLCFSVSLCLAFSHTQSLTPRTHARTHARKHARTHARTHSRKIVHKTTQMFTAHAVISIGAFTADLGTLQHSA